MNGRAEVIPAPERSGGARAARPPMGRAARRRRGTQAVGQRDAGAAEKARAGNRAQPTQARAGPRAQAAGHTPELEVLSRAPATDVAKATAGAGGGSRRPTASQVRPNGRRVKRSTAQGASTATASRAGGLRGAGEPPVFLAREPSGSGRGSSPRPAPMRGGSSGGAGEPPSFCAGR